MSATHTPGPWKYQRDGRSDAMLGKPGWDSDDPTQCGRNVYGNTYLVAHVPDTSPWCIEAEAEANAHLIAAAPELLAALLFVANDPRDFLGTQFTPQDAKAIRDAIAKATGKAVGV